MPRDLNPKSGRPPRIDWYNYVRSLPLTQPLLGLTHVTTGYILREIIDAGEIRSHKDCTVMKEPLTYLFYGRSAFRGAHENEPNRFDFRYPVVLLIDPNTAPKPKYAFGFDSGAFVGNMMDAHLDPYMPLFDFQIPPDPKAAAGLIEYVFGDSEKYLSNKVRDGFDVPPGNFEAVSYKSIVTNSIGAADRLDDRASTPELLFKDAISLSKSVKAAIIPNSLSSAPEIGGKLRSLSIPVFDYEWDGGGRPIEYHNTIRRQIKSLYKSWKWM